MLKLPPSPIFWRLCAACVLVLCSLFGMAVAAPGANAQEPPVKPAFVSTELRSECLDDEVRLGQALVPTENVAVRIPLVACGREGFRAVRTQALCAQAPGGIWLEQGQVCSRRYWWAPDIVASDCGALVAIADFVPPPLKRSDLAEQVNACVVPLLTNAAHRVDTPTNVPAGSRSNRPLTPACIEDPLIQDNAAAAGLHVGDSFASPSTGVSYLIVAGGPDCTFACADGFDLNCDGKLGDFCPVEIDRTAVAGVRACIGATRG